MTFWSQMKKKTPVNSVSLYNLKGVLLISNALTKLNDPHVFKVEIWVKLNKVDFSARITIFIRLGFEHAGRRLNVS